MTKANSIREQLRRNAVALISLAVAITSLGYNTWRNEASEDNRNQRLVAIELLGMLGDLNQVLLDTAYGEPATVAANRRRGWALVLTIDDLAMVAAGEVPAAAADLRTTWAQHFSALSDPATRETSKEAVEAALEATRAAVRDVLHRLG